jgi:hypothetical protein
MKRRSPAWVLIPAVILAIVVVSVMVSSFQVELGLMKPGKGERAAVAAAVAAQEASSGTGVDDYAIFSQALLVATVAQKNAAPTNPADLRVDNLLVQALDCLSALREAWLAEVEATWDPQTQGSPSYWNGLHPAMGVTEEGPLAAGDVRHIGAARATEFIERALSLAD